MKTSFYMYDDDTVKWEYEGKHYLLHVMNDNDPCDPREWDHITTMACFDNRYSLGDDIGNVSPEEFWQGLVREHVSSLEIFLAARNGALDGIRLEMSEEGDDLWDVYETCYLAGWQTSKEAKEYLEYSGIPLLSVADYIMDDLTVGHCQTLLEPYVAYMNLYLYDHSGITMRCGDSNPFSCRWDSGMVGWIVISKETMKRECWNEYVLDENGKRIKVEHKHDGMPSTYSYQTRPLTDDTWKRRAYEFMESDVEVYDQYLTGDVYGFVLYEYTPQEDDEIDEDDMDQIDSCWGFFGSDILENGIAEYCPGLQEAIEENRVEEGEATRHTKSYYSY